MDSINQITPKIEKTPPGIFQNLKKVFSNNYISFGSVFLLALVLLLSFLLKNEIFKFASFASEKEVFTSRDSVYAEPENGLSSGNIAKEVDEDSSGGSHIVFDKAVIDENFQPTAPFYSAFYYFWYKNPTSNGNQNYWGKNKKDFPKNWFSNYLPDIIPGVFDPVKELYDSSNYDTFKWQVTKMAEAKIEVAIAPWSGKNDKNDETLDLIINDFMSRPDNPYPNLRFAIYYDKKTTNTITTNEIASDLNHLIDKYDDNPYLLQVNDKPVLFVNANGNNNAAYVDRWLEANTKVNNYFYLNLEVFEGYETIESKVDSWHNFAPSNRAGTDDKYYYYISPGFNPVDNTKKLCRNLYTDYETNCDSSSPAKPIRSFESELTNMVNANVTWKIIETWNEWSEGTAVEPGTPTTLDTAGNQIEDKSEVGYGNTYIDILNTNLPDLEAGTGRLE